jgi:lipid-A-disaccharide synthase
VASTSAGPLIALVAGEASGDSLGASLIRAIAARCPEARFVGIGGPKMIAAGIDSWFPQEKLAVRGLVEVLKHLRELFAIRAALVRRLRAERPAVFIGIDAPDFNLGLETKLKRAGIPTMHYVSPTVWAWRAGRIRKIARAVSHMLVLFPFETKPFEAARIPVTFVGHPLAEEIPLDSPRAAAREALRVRRDRQVVALLPGSRQSEIEMMAPPFLAAAKRIHAERPDVAFLVPFATRETRELFELEIARADARALPMSLLFGHAHEAMAASDVVLVASGTATLEAALVKRPMVVAYRLSPLTYRIVRRLIRIPYVALPNILAGRFVVPEFLQDEASPEVLAQALLNALDDRTLEPALAATFAAMHRTLAQGAADRAADVVMQFLPARAPG